MLRAEPPAVLASERSVQRTLRHFPRKPRTIGVQRYNFPGSVSKHEQIAVCQMPVLSRSVLDRGFMIGGHQRAKGRNVGQKLSRAAEGHLLFTMKAEKGACGFLKSGDNFLPRLGLHDLAHQQEAE